MTREIAAVILRSVFTYAILLVLGRIIGRKLISRITFYDFIVGVTIGSIGVRIALGSQESPLLASISVVTITTLVVITDYLDIKSIKFRKWVDDEPVILISNGKLLDYNFGKVKITINELMMLLREKDIFNVDDVALAEIETDGQLTVLPKPNKQTVTTGDLNVKVKSSGLMIDIIIDGEIMYSNLQNTNHDEKWIKNELKVHKIANVEDVFYAGLNAQGNLYISKKHRNADVAAHKQFME